MKKVLLILSKDNYPSPEIILNIVPQGLPYIASSLEANGYEVYGLNPNYIQFEEDTKGYLKAIIQNKINAIKPDYIGLGGLSADYLFIRDAINCIREIDASIPVILGGGIISSDSTYIYDDLKPDFGVLLEGEITIVSLLNALKNNENLSNIQGIIYRKNGNTIQNEPQTEYVNLDELPYPNYDIFDAETFYRLSNQETMYFTGHTRLDPRVIVISGGRSCPFKCTFCYHSTGKKYRNRKIENIIEEIVFFHKKYNFNIVQFYDELFSVNEDRLINLCNAIIHLKKDTHIDFDWVCTMRVNQLKLPIMQKMKEAGCYYIGFGFESASDSVLKSMEKKIKKTDILNAIKICEEVGIGVQANFIFGDPAETIETQKETVDFFLEYCKDHIVHNGLISPFPSSPIWRHCLENNIITDKHRYYENIHKGNSRHNLMNMTKIKDNDFFTEIEDILMLDASLFKSVKILNTSNLENYRVEAECPHCRKTINYKYPHRDEGENLFKQLVAIKPLVNFCPECHKRVLIPTLNAFESFKLTFDTYLRDINAMASVDTPCALILGNEIRHIETYVSTIKTLEYNGLNLTTMNIASFYALKKENKDKKVLAYDLNILNKDSLNRDLKYIVLPHDTQSEVLNLLRQEKIENKNIVFLDFKKN